MAHCIAVKGKTYKTTEYKLSKAIIQNRRYSAYAVPPVFGGVSLMGLHLWKIGITCTTMLLYENPCLALEFIIENVVLFDV